MARNGKFGLGVGMYAEDEGLSEAFETLSDKSFTFMKGVEEIADKTDILRQEADAYLHAKQGVESLVKSLGDLTNEFDVMATEAADKGGTIEEMFGEKATARLTSQIEERKKSLFVAYKEIEEANVGLSKESTRSFDALSDTIRRSIGDTVEEWERVEEVRSGVNTLIREVESLTKRQEEMADMAEVTGQSIEQVFGRRATQDIANQLERRRKDLVEQYKVLKKEIPDASEDAAKAYEDLAKKVSSVTKDVSRDKKSLERGAESLANAYSGATRAISSGLAAISSGYLVMRGAQARGLQATIGHARSMTDQMDLVTSAFEGTYTEARVATRELQATFGSTLENTSRFRGEITRLSMGMNMDIGTTSKAYQTAFRMNMDTNEMFVGSMEDILKSTKMLGTDAEEMITSLGMMRSHWGMNQEAIKANVDAMTHIGQQFGMANEVMGRMPSIVSDIDKRYREMGVRSPEATMRTARSVAALAGAFGSLASPGEAMDMALEMSKSLADEQAQLRKMQYGLADDIGPIAQIFTEGLGDMGLAFELLEKQPDELAIALQEMAKEAEEQGGDTEWSFQRMRIQLQEVAPAMAAAMDSQEDLNKRLKAAGDAVSDPEKAMEELGETFADVGDKFFDTGRTMSESFRHRMDVIEERTIQASGISRREIGENMVSDFESITAGITAANKATAGWAATLVGASTPMVAALAPFAKVLGTILTVKTFVVGIIAAGALAIADLAVWFITAGKHGGYFAKIGERLAERFEIVNDFFAWGAHLLEKLSDWWWELGQECDSVGEKFVHISEQIVEWIEDKIVGAVKYLLGVWTENFARAGEFLTEKIIGPLIDLKDRVLDRIISTIKNFKSVALEAFEAVYDFLYDKFAPILKTIQGATDVISGAFEGVQNVGTRALEGIRGAGRRVFGNSIHTLAERDMELTAEAIEQAASKGAESFEDFSEEAGKAIGAIPGVGRALGPGDDIGTESPGVPGVGARATRVIEPRAAAERAGTDDIVQSINHPEWYYEDFKPLMMRLMEEVNRPNGATSRTPAMRRTIRPRPGVSDQYIAVDLAGNVTRR